MSDKDFGGKQLMPRDICSLVVPHFPNSKVKAVAVALAESAGWTGATHLNYDSDGNLSSKDCGLFQINIPASEIGSSLETELLTNVEFNVQKAYELYEQEWIRAGKLDVRRWEPWVSYTSGWATFPFSWIWAQNAQGEGTGPWEKTGRYIFKSIAGVANWHLVTKKDMSLAEALAFAQEQAKAFGITDGSEPIEYATKNQGTIISWKYAKAPTAAPPGNHGPRPEPNNGF